MDARLQDLSGPCRQMLCTAAVLGLRLDLDVLAEMLGQTAAALLPAWEEALARGLLVASGGELAFAHEPLRCAVADSVPPAVRDAVRRQYERLGGAGQRPLGKITNRERAALSLVARGHSNQQIARALGISEHAVKRHVSNMLIKFDCANRTELALLAIRRRWAE
ncbi:helix-turn-helix transcriptional regulator [Nonomuraea cavernae]|uniref:helix-turn-helix transcriptional regulator n=1 Tax=Nonomuraea cavernae TaxID=2045107 RepID=UPI0034094DE0